MLLLRLSGRENVDALMASCCVAPARVCAEYNAEFLRSALIEDSISPVARSMRALCGRIEEKRLAVQA